MNSVRFNQPWTCLTCHREQISCRFKYIWNETTSRVPKHFLGWPALMGILSFGLFSGQPSTSRSELLPRSIWHNASQAHRALLWTSPHTCPESQRLPCQPACMFTAVAPCFSSRSQRGRQHHQSAPRSRQILRPPACSEKNGWIGATCRFLQRFTFSWSQMAREVDHILVLGCSLGMIAIGMHPASGRLKCLPARIGVRRELSVHEGG